MRRLLPVAAAVGVFAGVALGSTSGVWELTSYSDFIKGKFEGVSLGRDGRLSMAPRLDTLFASEQPVIWSVITGPDGALYAATGHRGRVFRIDASGKATVVWTADRPEVFAIATDKRGVLYAASSPDGKIYRIENGKAEEYFNPKTKYIWSLAVAPDGVLYAGTGEGGRVFRVTGPGQGGEYYSTGQTNVTSVLIDGQGRVLAGTAPNGILYRITAKDKAFVLYDADLPEIRAILPGANGAIYAAGLGGSLVKQEQAAQQAAQAAGDATPTISTTITVTADNTGGDLKPNPPEPKQPQQTAPASATPQVMTQATTTTENGNVEKSAIYRINPDNTVDTLWSSKEENVYDVLPAKGGGIYFGTDENGRIYQLSPDRRLTLVAQTNESEAIRLLDWRGALLAATANMGKIYELGAEGSKGSYESPVFDAGSVAQWGKLKWRGDGTVAMRTRSGNSLRPDATWSDWSAAASDARGSQITSPAARFLQFSAALSGPKTEIEYVTAAYLPQNNPPVVRSITVLTQAVAAGSSTKISGSAASTSAATTTPYTITVTDTGDAGPVASTGTPTQTLSRAAAQQLLISWQADDPDGDKLVYDVQFRGDGEREWKYLRRNLHDNSFTIDGDALADGRYFFKVTASDREANPPSMAKEAVLVSSPVLIDNTPPVIRIASSGMQGNGAEVVFEAHDDQSAIRRAEWSIDAGPWTPFAPVDGILDSQTEQFRLKVPDVPAGEHLLVIRVADSGNNTALAKVVLR